MPKKLIKFLKTSIKVVIPIVLLLIIFNRVDYKKFPEIIISALPYMVILFFLNNPIRYLLFNLRWHITTSISSGIKFRNISYSLLFQTVYKGLFYGYFVPGTFGVDIYRIYYIGKKYGSYEIQTGIILGEKIMALLAYSFVILLTYPFVKQQLPDSVNNIFDIVFILFFGILFFTSVIIVISKGQFLKSRIVLLTKKYTEKMAQNIFRRIFKANSTNVSLTDVFSPLANYKVLLITFTVSVINQIIGAFFVYIIFTAFDVSLPFSAYLFVVPLMGIIFLLPISFGGIGLRETAYVLLYGAFGVPPEICLLVSVISFIYLLINNSFGGLISLYQNLKSTINI